MPHDLAVSASSPTVSTAELISRTETAETATPHTPVAEKATSSNSGTLFANPTVQLNADLGIVVIQFRNEQGVVTSQIPSQLQLDAYMTGSAKLPNEEGGHDAETVVGDAA